MLKLRGDYLAIVTLGFGEIIRIFLNNLDARSTSPTAPRASDRSVKIFLGSGLGRLLDIDGSIPVSSLYYYLFLVLVVISVVICHRLLRDLAHRPRLDGHP